MLEKLLKDRGAIRRMRAGPLGAHLDSIVDSLLEAGYSRSTARSHLWLMVDFGRWLVGRDIALAEIDETAVLSFVAARRRKGRQNRSLRAAVGRVVDHLRGEGLAPQSAPADDPTSADLLIGRFEAYLHTERGVAEVTVATYRSFVRTFLDECFGVEPVVVGRVTPADVSAHLLRQAQSLPAARARGMVTALRSFFRFLVSRGETDVDLSGCVLSVADRKKSGVPKFLEEEELERLLDACDQHTGIGRRDYAILLLLARLGLRASEALALELGDVDWRAAEIVVRGKGSTRERLPLPAEVGGALVTYLREDRPQCASRRVFIRTRAPRRGFANPSSVSTVVRRALERAGLHPPVRGAHLLRHSLATGMLRRGARFSEIGQLLRHRTSSATEVYAKVDFASLRLIAQPWPRQGGKQ